MRAAVASILAFGVACAAPQQAAPERETDPAKLAEDAQGKAAHARKTWEAAQESESLARGRFEAALSPEAELIDATETRLRAERDLAIADLAVDEIAASGWAPDRYLDAPLVEGQDFVLRWLEIEEVYAERIRDNRVRRHALAKQWYDAGLASFDAVLPSDGDAAIARVEHQRWRDLAALRRRVTANAIGPSLAFERAGETIYSTDVSIARIRVRTADRIKKLLGEYFSQGLRTEAELAAADSELLRLQNELHEAEMGRGPGLIRPVHSRH